MKFKFLALALVATIAGATSAQVLKPIPEPAGALPPSESQRRSLAIPAKVSAAPVRSAVASDVTRPPVPLLLAARRAVVPAIEAALDPVPMNTDAAPPGKMTGAAAKAAMEADGYKGIRALSQGPDGVWSASALRGQTEVRLSVNSTGNVSAN
ncbi:MAG: hypothetical protein PSV46_08925 [Reyranella sp.]|nr:hypothetical protein [Reyranella sp.]